MILGIFVGILLILSLFFSCVGVISMYRFPDFYTRLHGGAKCTAFGVIFAIFALLLYSFARFMAVEGENHFPAFFIHVLIAGAVFLVSGPAGNHALARAAHRAGVLPEPAIADALEEMEKRGKGVTA